LQQLFSTVAWFEDDEQRSGVETDRCRLPKLKIETSEVMRSIEDVEGDVVDAEVLLLISNGVIVTLAVAVVVGFVRCVGELSSLFVF
jgi:hypothetical protein